MLSSGLTLPPWISVLLVVEEAPFVFCVGLIAHRSACSWEASFSPNSCPHEMPSQWGKHSRGGDDTSPAIGPDAWSWPRFPCLLSRSDLCLKLEVALSPSLVPLLRPLPCTRKVLLWSETGAHTQSPDGVGVAKLSWPVWWNLTACPLSRRYMAQSKHAEAPQAHVLQETYLFFSHGQVSRQLQSIQERAGGDPSVPVSRLGAPELFP